MIPIILTIFIMIIRWHARQNWVKLRDSQIVISTYWKRWKDKSHITELKMRRKQEWAVVIVQKHYRRWQV